MIKKLDHRSIAVSKKIRAIFQESYAVEAKLLQAKIFPPLQREIDGFLHSDTEFFGYYKNREMVAVIELKRDKESTHIQSLVVAPKFFKQGIAQGLISYLFDASNSMVYTVETGAANLPAIGLYKKNGFVEIGHYNADFDIKKVRFEKKITTTP